MTKQVVQTPSLQAEWQLTEEERTQLHAYAGRREGFKEIMKILMELVASDKHLEVTWWNRVFDRLDVPLEIRSNLVANSATGKLTLIHSK